MQKCTHCGWNIPDDTPVCPYCGFPVESEDEKRRRRFMLRWHLNALLLGMKQPSQGFLLSAAPSVSRARGRSAVTFLVVLASVLTLAVLITGLFASQQGGTGFAQVPPPVLLLSGNIIPGGTISVQGRNFTPGGTVTLTIDGHTVMQLAPQTAKNQPIGTSVHVMSDGTFEATIQVDSHWSVGSSHLLVATDQSSYQHAHVTVSVPRQAELVSCTHSTATNSIALGPVLAGQKRPVSAVFTLCTTGSGVVHWMTSWDQRQAKWLQVDPTGQIQAPLSKQIMISASAGNIEAGSYSATVTFSDQNSPTKMSLRVIFIVRSAQATECLKTSTASLSFVATQNQSDPDPQTVTLTNCGPTGFWSASTANGSGWLGIDPLRGNLKAGEMQDVKVSAFIADLPANQYNDTITFTISTSSGTSQAMVPVSLRVQPLSPAQLCNVNGLDLGELQQGQSTSGVITFGNCGGQALQWSAGFTDGWSGVTLNNSGGTVPPDDTGQISVTATAGSGDLGKLSAVFSINSNGGTQQATVSVTVVPPSPPPCLQIIAVDGKQPSDSSNVTLSLYPDSSSKVTVANCGADNGAISAAVSTSDGGNWLSTDLQPDTSLAVDGNQDITITISASAPYNVSGTVGVTLTTSGGEAMVMINISVISPLQ